jgi:hypothetical protein
MDKDLQQRCRAFLGKPVPPGVRYVPDSLAERILTSYAQGLRPDPGLTELLFICAPESRAAAARHAGAARDYLLESASLLEAISQECGA